MLLHSSTSNGYRVYKFLTMDVDYTMGFQLINNSNLISSLITAMAEEQENLVAAHELELKPPDNDSNNNDNTKLELTVDEVIEEYVGSFGFSQLIHVFLVSLAWIFGSQSTLVSLFSDAQPSWACKGGGAWCSSTGGDTSKSVPPGSVCGLEPGSWEWVGGNTVSTVAEWGLICDNKFLAGLPASLFFIGSLFGSGFYGRLADAHLGRKKTVLLSCLLTSITGFLTSLSANIWIYSFLRFSNGFARSGIGICCLVLSTEAVGRKWRGPVGQYGFFFNTIGFLSLPLIAYPTRANWRNIYRVISILPLLYSLLILPFVSESPRWLVVKGRPREAMEVLHKLATLNGRTLPDNLKLIVPSVASEVGKPSLSKKNLWSARWAAKRMITVMSVGLGVGFVYFGIQLNMGNMDFNLYFTVALNAMMEIPAVFIASVLLSFMDRRVILSSAAFTAGVSCILCMFLSTKAKTKGEAHEKKRSSGSWPQLTAEAVAFMAISTAFDVLYIYAVELFPTNVRNLAVSFLRQAMMLGASLAPLLVVLGRLSPSISFLVLGGLAIFSGLMTLLLPETRNAPLYETLEQQEQDESISLPVSDSGLELGKQ